MSPRARPLPAVKMKIRLEKHPGYGPTFQLLFRAFNEEL